MVGWSAGCAETCLSGVGGAGRKPTAEMQQGAVLRPRCGPMSPLRQRADRQTRENAPRHTALPVPEYGVCQGEFPT